MPLPAVRCKINNNNNNRFRIILVGATNVRSTVRATPNFSWFSAGPDIERTFATSFAANIRRERQSNEREQPLIRLHLVTNGLSFVRLFSEWPFIRTLI